MKEITNPPPYQHFGSEPEYLGGASPDRRVTTEKKNQKALKTQCFQGFFVVRVKGLVVSEEKRHHMLSRQAHSTVAFFIFFCLIKRG